MNHTRFGPITQQFCKKAPASRSEFLQKRKKCIFVLTRILSFATTISIELFIFEGLSHRQVQMSWAFSVYQFRLSHFNNSNQHDCSNWKFWRIKEFPPNPLCLRRLAFEPCKSWIMQMMWINWLYWNSVNWLMYSIKRQSDSQWYTWGESIDETNKWKVIDRHKENKL